MGRKIGGENVEIIIKPPLRRAYFGIFCGVVCAWAGGFWRDLSSGHRPGLFMGKKRRKAICIKREPEKYFSDNLMPMNSGQLESTTHKNVRVVPVEPNVKSVKTRKLFNAGVSAKAKTEKSADPPCYNTPVSRKTDPAVDAAGLFDNQIRRDTMTSTPSREMEARWSELEHKHNLRCLWSEVIGNRTIQVECMWVPSAGTTILVTKHYDHPIPKTYSSKKQFPKMVAHYAYFPAGGVTWETMDEALTDLKAQVDETRKEAREAHLTQ